MNKRFHKYPYANPELDNFQAYEPTTGYLAHHQPDLDEEKNDVLEIQTSIKRHSTWQKQQILSLLPLTKNKL
jgi:hypothetical protein